MESRSITIRGIVQGVGFRPFVYGVATRLGLKGTVKNIAGSVHIEIEGPASALDVFLHELTANPPPLARIENISSTTQTPRGESTFRIEASETNAAGPVAISPDIATCPDCLRELFDPRDRRYRYPFLNCTNCGPRLTIILAAPYDRERTTMASFTMCPLCRAEYEDPTNRRFHAQPTACPVCGPQLQLCDPAGRPIPTQDPLAATITKLRAGRICAIKGLGGYHLACDARNPETLAELRRRKQRDEKPFALMVRDLEAAAQLCEISATESELLQSPRRPIVLLRKRPDCPLPDLVAPGNPFLGLMLPYTPLHHLLLHDCPIPLVMTSGNRSDEPMAYDDADALVRLAGIADSFLAHNRPIHVRCDDSVTRIVAGAELPIRRSRGYAPQSVPLPLTCARSLLAVGGQLKGTFALLQMREPDDTASVGSPLNDSQTSQAIISHHMGDLDYIEAYDAFTRDITLYELLFAVRPACIIHDLHPDYSSTRYARARAAKEQIPLIAVQHHHAHIAGCMAENHLTNDVIGVSFDGTGYGIDGAIWGGEFLIANLATFRRAAHLRYVGMPGGEAAVRQPWRLAAAHLLDAGLPLSSLAPRIPDTSLAMIEQMIRKQINMPLTSSAGRLFDAVSALIGVRDQISYEAQAAIQLEQLATHAPPDGSYPFELTEPAAPSNSQFPIPNSSPLIIIDTRPTIRALVEDLARNTPQNILARRFHSTLVAIIVATCTRLREQTGLIDVALSGGVFMNALLAAETFAQLQQAGFRPHRHHLVPPNDGGLCYGQLAVATVQLTADRSPR